MIRFILSCIAVLALSFPALAGSLPFDCSYELAIGDVPDLAGTQRTDFLHTLKASKVIELGINNLAVRPFVEGSLALEDILDDVVVTTASGGADLLILRTENLDLSAGLVFHRTYYRNDNSDSRTYFRVNLGL